MANLIECADAISDAYIAPSSDVGEGILT